MIRRVWSRLVKSIRKIWDRISQIFKRKNRAAIASNRSSAKSSDPIPRALSSPNNIEQNFHGNQNINIAQVAPDANVDIKVVHQAAPIPTQEPQPFKVPYQRNSYFSGRHDELEQLHQQLNQESSVAITQIQAVSGLGGIGKTQLAVEYAYRFYRDRSVYTHIFWINAESEATIVTDYASLANQLALPMAQATQEEKIPAVQSWLANHGQWLLVFDNADTPDLLVPWMPNNPEGRILITSRATVFDQLGIRNPLALDILSQEEALELLFSRTEYQRTSENEAAAIALNQELEGLPLALEQASAYMLRKGQGLRFQGYLNLYRKQGLSFLEGEQAKTGQYLSSVLTTWKINMDAIAQESPGSIELMNLSAFLAPDEIPYFMVAPDIASWDISLAQAMQEEATEEVILAFSSLMEPLSQYSLAQWEPERQVYRVHRLVQAVVRNGLSSERQDQWLERMIESVAQAYPGSAFEQWYYCEQLLPHWLHLIDATRILQIQSESLGAILNQAGFYLSGQGRYSEAEPLYIEALAMRKRVLGDEHPDVATSLNNLAELYRSQGRYSEAEPLYIEALAIGKRVLGDEHPDVATSLNNLALLYYSQGRYSEAEPLYIEALAMRERVLGDEHPDVATSLNNLAALYRSQGRYSEAEPLYIEALAMRKRVLGDEHPDVARSLNNLALLYHSQGRYSEAEPLYVKAIEIMFPALGQEHPNTQTVLNNFLTCLNQALSTHQVGNLSDHPLTLQFLELLRSQSES